MPVINELCSYNGKTVWHVSLSFVMTKYRYVYNRKVLMTRFASITIVLGISEVRVVATCHWSLSYSMWVVCFIKSNNSYKYSCQTLSPALMQTAGLWAESSHCNCISVCSAQNQPLKWLPCFFLPREFLLHSWCVSVVEIITISWMALKCRYSWVWKSPHGHI